MVKRFFLLIFIISLLFPFRVLAGEPGYNIINGSNIPSSVNWLFFIPEDPGNLSRIDSFSANNVVVRLHANWSGIGQRMLTDPAGAAHDWATALNQHVGKIKYVEPFNELEVDGERNGQTVDQAVAHAVTFINTLRSLLDPSIVITSPGLSENMQNGPAVLAAFAAHGLPINSFGVISWHAYITANDENAARGFSHLGALNYDLSGKQFLITEFGVKDSGPQGALYTDCAFIWYLCHNPSSSLASFFQSQGNIIAYFQWSQQPFSGSWRLSDASGVIPANLNKCTDINIPASPTENNCTEKIVYKTVPTQNGYNGGIPGCININADDRSGGPFWARWFMPPSNTFDKCFTPGGDWSYGTPVVDPCGNANKPSSISKDILVKWIGSPETIYHTVKSIFDQAHQVDTRGKQFNDLDYPAPNYNTYLPNGSFNTASPNTNLKTLNEVNKSVTDLQAGSLVRTTPYVDLNDTVVNNWLCKLASSNTSAACVNDTAYQLVDLPLGYLGDMVEGDFTTRITGAASVVKDRTITRRGKPDLLIKASDIYCSLKPACSDADLGPIQAANNANCANAVKLDTHSDLFKAFYTKLRLKISDNTLNVPQKAIFERCSEDVGIKDGLECAGMAQAIGAYALVEGDLMDLKFIHGKENIPDKVLTQYNGKFLKMKGGQCWSCNAEALLLPGLNQAAQANKKLSQYASSYQTNSQPIPIQKVIYLKDQNPQLETTKSRASLGEENYDKHIDVVSFDSIIKLITSIINGTLQTPSCAINWLDEIFGKHDDGSDIIKKIAQNTCNSDAPARVETILWTTTSTQEVYDYSNRLNTDLMPYQVVSNLKDSKTYHGFDTKYNVDMGGCQGAREMSLNGTRDTNCGTDAVNDTGKMIPVFSGPSDEATQSARFKLFIPLSEQNSANNPNL